MSGRAEGPGQLSARPWVRAAFSGPAPGMASLCLPSWALTRGVSAAGFSSAPALVHALWGSDKSPRPHPEPETACGAAPGAAFYQGKSGSPEVNRVQVHFSNICKLLSVTAKSKLSVRKHQVFCIAFLLFPALAHVRASIHLASPLF